MVTEKRAAPKERVRMDKQPLTEEETVSEQVREEQIERRGRHQESTRRRRK